jgi:hypothetical protein
LDIAVGIEHNAIHRAFGFRQIRECHRAHDCTNRIAPSIFRLICNRSASPPTASETTHARFVYCPFSVIIAVAADFGSAIFMFDAI